MSNRIEKVETAINDLTRQGKILDSIDRYFAEDCVFFESDGSQRSSRAAQRAHLEKFFASLKSFDGADLHAQTVGDAVTMSEWTFKMTAGDGEKIVWNEVLVRRWRDGLVIEEKYYTM